MEKSVVYKALESYQIYLQTGATPFEKADLDAVFRCKKYLENGGEENAEWLLSSMVILKAVAHYHKRLDMDLREAKNKNDDALIAALRVDQRMISTLHARLDKFYSRFI